MDNLLQDQEQKHRLRRCKRDDLVSYYRSNYFPNNSAIVIAGDLTLREATAKLEKAFGSWKQGKFESKSIPEPAQMQ